jgi:hypothetical protein
MSDYVYRADGSGDLHEEWLIAESLDGRRTYLVHGRWPRFVAQIFDEGESGALDSLSYSLPSGQVLARFVWLDLVNWQTHPAEPRLLDLLAAAHVALDDYDARLDGFDPSEEDLD